MTAEIERKIDEMQWFHSIDFGEFASSGRFRPGRPQNISLYGFMDLIKDIPLKGMTVLDVGATDGLATFGMRALGAECVHSTDSLDKEGFRLAQSLLKLDNIHYYPETQIADFAQLFSRRQFDLILCAGVIYHMLNPLSAFVECRKIIKPGGLLILETPYYKNEDRAAVFLNTETEMMSERNTYSVPTKAAVIGMMKLTGFDVIATRLLARPHRITVVGRASPLEDIRDRSTLLRRVHEVDFCDNSFKLTRDIDGLPSAISFSGWGAEHEIDPDHFNPRFPYHPPPSRPTFGTTTWSTPDGNT